MREQIIDQIEGDFLVTAIEEKVKHEREEMSVDEYEKAVALLKKVKTAHILKFADCQ